MKHPWLILSVLAGAFIFLRPSDEKDEQDLIESNPRPNQIQLLKELAEHIEENPDITNTKIAKKFNVDKSMVVALKKFLGITHRLKAIEMKKERVRKFIEKHPEWRDVDIGRKFELSKSLVWQVRHEGKK